jgi:hypothetical protein
MGYPRNLSVFAENVSSQGVLTVAGGGTGATTLAGIRTAIGAAASGANSDITSLSGLTTPLSVLQGGTGTNSLSGLRSAIGAAASGANSDITSLSGLTTPLSVAQGGSGVTVSTGASSLVLRDSAANVTANYFYASYVNTAAAGTTTTLTASSAFNYVVTGSGGQTFKLPDATTLPSGAVYTFNNNQSSGTIVVQNNSGTTVATVQSGSFVYLTLLSNSIAAGSWDNHNALPSAVTWTTNSLIWTGTITSGTTWNGVAIGALYGGTGLTSPGASGNVLTSNGSAWTSQPGVTLGLVFAIAAAL